MTAVLVLLTAVALLKVYDVVARRVECSHERNLEPLDGADGASR